MRYTLIILLLLIGLFGCKKYESEINLIFDKEELETQDAIINFLDSVVIDYTGIKNFKKAYPIYFDSCKSATINQGDIILIGISDIDIFLKSLNQEHLKEYYNIEDTITFRYPKIHDKAGETKIITNAYQKTFNHNGKFAELLKILKKDNSYIERYYDNLMCAGDFSAGNINGVINYCSDYNLIKMIIRTYTQTYFYN